MCAFARGHPGTFGKPSVEPIGPARGELRAAAVTIRRTDSDAVAESDTITAD